MKIKQIRILNYKSIRDVQIIAPNSFSVFVGSNASGKSNIFQAIEFTTSLDRNSFNEVERLYQGLSNFSNRLWYVSQENYTDYDISHDSNPEQNDTFNSTDFLGVEMSFSNDCSPYFYIYKSIHGKKLKDENGDPLIGYTIKFLGLKRADAYKQLYDSSVISKVDSKEYSTFIGQHSRIFIGNNSSEKISYNDEKRLSTACGNLEKVLKRILKDKNKRAEIVEWLQLLVPGFENIEIKSEELSGSDNLLIYEKGSYKPFNKSLISDGTYNIIALLTAVYQSDEPQFLCIEEPENGLNPKVVRELVGFFREQCETKGHYIWLNTHSQTLVSELTPEEIILVDKKNGETQIKQIKGKDLHGLRMDEALLSGILGGGNPW